MDLIKDIILKDDISIDIKCSIAEALKMMEKNHQGVVVVLSNGLPASILTERDLLRLIEQEIELSDKIETILRFNHLITTNMQRTIEYALHVLIDNNIRRLIVVDDNNRFQGIVTQDILIKHLEDDTFKTSLLVSDFLRDKPSIVTLNQTDSIKDAFSIMNKNNIGSIIALDEQGKAVGILTERDTIKIMNNKNNLSAPIKNVMSFPIITIQEDEKVKDVVHFMDKNNIRRVVVLDKSTQEPSTIISLRDIAHNLKGNYGKILESKLKNVKHTLNYIGESILEVYEDNSELIIHWANDVAIKNFGNIIDHNILKLIDQSIWSQIYENIKKTGECNKLKIQIKDKFYELLCSQHYLDNKETLLLLLRDISDFEYAVIDANKRSEDFYKELQILQGVIDQQSNIVIVTDGEEIISANQSLYSFFNVKNIEDFVDTHKNISNTFIKHINFFSIDDHEDENWIENILKLNQKDRIVSILDLNTFEPKAFTVQANPLKADETNYAVTLTDITDIKLESQQYHYHATHDALTQIYNRSYYFEKISNSIAQSKRYNTSFCVILFDIDHFKRFNDTYGHLKGDEVLVKVSSVVHSHVRASDTFARWGGEEFIILLEETGLSKAELIAEHFRKIIEGIDLDGLPTITCSFGVTQYKEDDTDNCLLKRADDALYQAKEAGRNVVVAV
ncbi:MAG: diguanylate cyclase [Campylobacterota bacterium]|nr:diguanylate cyclase [Campylobacterota bacterium]